MEEQLISAAINNTIISPTLVTKLTSVESGVEAELAAIALYKENNREEDTPTLQRCVSTARIGTSKL